MTFICAKEKFAGTKMDFSLKRDHKNGRFMMVFCAKRVARYWQQSLAKVLPSHQPLISSLNLLPKYNH
jgi:hypothetical protein